MEAPKTLRPPSNWQDFEKLCKILWGEIWKCPEIVRHGRAGQAQHGVDVYGTPDGETEYYGIQCKGKDENLKTQFSQKEIVDEVKEAQSFSPPLKKFYLATTAPKNAKIEEFVRNLNIKNKKAGLFEVHLFSWEDIVDLIDRNKETHDWYVKSQKYATKNSVTISFTDNLTEIVLTPKFLKRINYYKSKSKNKSSYEAHKKAQNIENLVNRGRIVSTPLSETYIDYSYSEFSLVVFNSGSESLDEYKLQFEFEGEIIDFKKYNTRNEGLVMYRPNYINDIHIKSKNSGDIIPTETTKILVSEDQYISNKIYLKPLPKEYEILLNWKLISKNYKESGTLKILIKPHIEVNKITIWEDEPQIIDDEEGTIYSERVEEEFFNIERSDTSGRYRHTELFKEP